MLLLQLNSWGLVLHSAIVAYYVFSFSYVNIYFISFINIWMFWFNDAFSCFIDVGLTGLTHLDLFGARITDVGTNHLRSMLDNTLIFLLPILINFSWLYVILDLVQENSVEYYCMVTFLYLIKCRRNLEMLFVSRCQ